MRTLWGLALAALASAAAAEDRCGTVVEPGDVETVRQRQEEGTYRMPGAVAGGMAPDLRASPVMTSFESIADITRNGSRLDRGMPRFAWMQDEHILAIQHYIRDRANRALEQ